MQETMEQSQARAHLLIECLPYIRQFQGEVIVIKYGGHAMKDDELKRSFALNVALLKYIGLRPVIVHGGGPQINNMLDQLSIPSTFRDGLRVTDDATMDVVEMVLVGKVNKEIVSLLQSAGVKAVGLSGKDGQLIRVRKMRMLVNKGTEKEELVDLGRVGEVIGVETSLIHTLTREGFIPVIAPTGIDADNETYNVNADAIAAAVAAALKARRMLLLTDVPGILDRSGSLLTSLTMLEAQNLFKDGTIKEGMIPKVRCCLDALTGGVEKAMVIDGRVKNCILLELFTDSGIGTEILSNRLHPEETFFAESPSHPRD